MRGASDPERFVLLDVESLLESLADDQQACGHAVSVTGCAVPLQAQASSLKRCIPEGELARVLTPFYRVEASRNRNSGGVGLGLSIAHDIARRHQGLLRLRNGDVVGLVATLTLPRKAAV